MKKILVFIQCVLCFVSGSLYAQTDSAAKANFLINIEQSLCDALPGDTLTWSRYLDPYWYAVTEDGTGINRKEFLNGFSPFSKGVSGNIRVIHPVCLFHDSIAVVHYVADENEIVYGQKLHTSYAAMDTWYQTGKSWRMMSMQIFEIPQLPLAVKSNVADLTKFTGTYELTDNKTAEISLRNDSLFIQKSGHAPESLYQETNNVFFIVKDTRGRLIFTKDETGKKIMVQRRNGQDLVWKMKSVNQ